MRCLYVAFAVGCGARAVAPTAAPDFRPVAIEPAPRAALYADCLADAVANQRYGRATDPDTTLLLFTCSGPSARAFFDGLAEHSAKVGSEFQRDGKTYRSTARVRRDLFGVDYCSADECVITLNAGDFVR